MSTVFPSAVSANTPATRTTLPPPKSIWLTDTTAAYPPSVSNDAGSDIFTDPSRSPRTWSKFALAASLTGSGSNPYATAQTTSVASTHHPDPTSVPTVYLPSQPGAIMIASTPSTTTLARALDFQDPGSPSTSATVRKQPRERSTEPLPRIPPTPAPPSIRTAPTPTPTPGRSLNGISTTTIISASLLLKNSSHVIRPVSRHGSTNHEQLLLRQSSSNPPSAKRIRNDTTPMSALLKDMTPLTKDSVRRVRTALDYTATENQDPTASTIVNSSATPSSFAINNDHATPVLSSHPPNDLSHIPNLRIDIPSILTTKDGLPVVSLLDIHTPRLSTPLVTDTYETNDQQFSMVHPMSKTPSTSNVKPSRISQSTLFQTPTTTDRVPLTNSSSKVLSQTAKSTPFLSQAKPSFDAHPLLNSIRNSPYGKTTSSSVTTSALRNNSVRRTPDIVSFAFVSSSRSAKNTPPIVNPSISLPASTATKVSSLVASNVVLAHVNPALETQRIMHQSSLDQHHDNLTEQRIKERIHKSVHAVHSLSSTHTPLLNDNNTFTNGTDAYVSPSSLPSSSMTVHEFFDSLDRLYYDTYNEYDDEYYLNQAKFGLGLLASRSEILLSLPSLLTKDYFNTNSFPYGIERTPDGLRLDEKITIPFDPSNNNRINYKDLLQANMNFLRLPLIRIQHILELCRAVRTPIHEEYQRLVRVYRNSRNQYDRMMG